MTRKQATWLLLIGALAFAVAACAAQKGTSPGTGGGAAAAQGRSSQASSGGGQAAQPSAAAGGTSEGQRTSTERTPLGDRIEIRKSWVQVRSKPSQDSTAVALVFGNDRLQVIETQGDWIHVRFDGNREGWIPVAATEDP